MGNTVNCCGEKKITNKLEQVNNMANISEFISEEIKRIGEIQNNYGTNDPIMNIENYQYYLNLSKNLIQIKIILDDFIQFEKENKNKDLKNNKIITKYNGQIVDIKKTKKFLEKVLNTEDNYDLKKLEDISSDIESNILSTNDDKIIS